MLEIQTWLQWSTDVDLSWLRDVIGNMANCPQVVISYRCCTVLPMTSRDHDRSTSWPQCA